MEHPFTNRLAKESSPYLLQHAQNPVDWFAWGEEALAKAIAENKPILVSIGYSACHWCHVMERESFENPEIADFMNRHFVNIKIDREERPDLDHIYMDAVQAMTGSGGWPLNVFLTPQCKPFYGGTYFPPISGHNRPSWKELLQSIVQVFRDKRQELETQSDNLIAHLLQSSGFGQKKGGSGQAAGADFFDQQSADSMYAQVMQSADKLNGGFGPAPKFPQTFVIQFLLHHYYHTGNETALSQARLSLDRMIAGGIYDQIGGGFSRYSTDDTWLVPHFEKMLYDNALLITILSEIYQLTGEQRYLDCIQQTMDFVRKNWVSPEGGFYSALDADSEGEEGKYYVWSQLEIQELLGPEAALFCARYGVSEAGNWEGNNILHQAVGIQDLASKEGVSEEYLTNALKVGRDKVLTARSQRVAPLLDDKILLSWNALMVSACCKAYGASGTESYKELAIANMEFIWNQFQGEGIYRFYHSFQAGQARFPAFLDDYANLVAALIQLQEITGDNSYLSRAKEITGWVLENFQEEAGGFFYFTHKDQRDVIIRKKELFDGAVPSGNSVMSTNLWYLSVVFDLPDWKQIAYSNCGILQDAVSRYPSSFGAWATLIQAIAYIPPEIVIVGEKTEITCKEFLRIFTSYRIFQSATSKNDHFPLLRDKPLTRKPLIYLCQRYTCQNPVTEVDELILLLKNVQKFRG